MDVLLHNRTSKRISQLINTNTQSILITGVVGSGKETIAYEIAQKLTGQSAKSNPQILLIKPENGVILIDSIRKISKFILLKTHGQKAIRRVIIIVDAERMKRDAQNMLLKTLEEPPSDTAIILTSSQPSLLIDTVKSRTAKVNAYPVSDLELAEYLLSKGFPEDIINQQILITSGAIGLTISLLEDSNENEISQSIKLSKQILSEKMYDRLLRIEALTSDKQQLRSLINSMKIIFLSASRNSISNGNFAQTELWVNRLGLILELENAMKRNCNSKLLLTKLMLNI